MISFWSMWYAKLFIRNCTTVNLLSSIVSKSNKMSTLSFTISDNISNSFVRSIFNISKSLYLYTQLLAWCHDFTWSLKHISTIIIFLEILKKLSIIPHFFVWNFNFLNINNYRLPILISLNTIYLDFKFPDQSVPCL